MLDVITQAQIWNLMLKEVKERHIGLLMVTHNKALAEQVCTRSIDLRKQNFNAAAPVSSDQIAENIKEAL